MNIHDYIYPRVWYQAILTMAGVTNGSRPGTRMGQAAAPMQSQLHATAHAAARTIHVDIGGGSHADYFQKLARANPDHLYLTLDPAVERPPGAYPPNLRLLKWRSDNDPAARSQLPLKARSVDTVHLSFLFGELHGRSVPTYVDDPYYYDHAAELERYRHLLQSVKHALKPGGRVHVSEPQANIQVVQKLCREAGFTILDHPTIIADKHKTAWVKTFYHIVDQAGGSATASPAVPMEFVAVGGSNTTMIIQHPDGRLEHLPSPARPSYQLLWRALRHAFISYQRWNAVYLHPQSYAQGLHCYASQ